MSAGTLTGSDRQILALMRKHGDLTKADLAGYTGLTPQAVSLCMRRLSDHGLVVSMPRIRGRIGKPSIPWNINPDGCYSIGLKVGRRRLEIALSDFTGELLSLASEVVPFPTPETVLDFLSRHMPVMTASALRTGTGKVTGLGVSIPPKLWEWGDLMETPEHILELWRSFDVEGHFSTATGLAVHMMPDTMAAALAEATARPSSASSSFAHFHVGWFAGGALIFDGRVFRGPNGTAGALGSLLVRDHYGGLSQLLSHASVSQIDANMRERGAMGYVATGDLDSYEAVAAIETWMPNAAQALAEAIAAVAAVTGVREAVIDGAMPPSMRESLIEKVIDAHDALDTRGVERVNITHGMCGPDARAKGAALLPILDRYDRGDDGLSM